MINQLVTRGPHPVPTSSYIQNKSNGAPVELVANNETWTIGFMVDAEWYVEVSINGRTPQSSMLCSDFPWNKPSSDKGVPHDYGNPHDCLDGWTSTLGFGGSTLELNNHQLHPHVFEASKNPTKNMDWLAVSTILKNMKVNGKDYPI